MLTLTLPGLQSMVQLSLVMRAGLLVTRWLLIVPNQNWQEIISLWATRLETSNCTLMCKYWKTLLQLSRSRLSLPFLLVKVQMLEIMSRGTYEAINGSAFFNRKLKINVNDTLYLFFKTGNTCDCLAFAAYMIQLTKYWSTCKLEVQYFSCAELVIMLLLAIPLYWIVLDCNLRTVDLLEVVIIVALML